MKSGRVIVLVLVILLVFGVDIYAFQAIETATRTNGWLAAFAHTAYWSVSAGILFFFVYGMINMRGSKNIPAYFKATFNIFLTLFVTKATLLIVLFGEDIYRGAIAVAHLFSGSTENILPERKVLVSQTGLVLSLIPFVSFVYGTTKGKYRYKVHKQVLHFDDLPDAFDGFTIAQISDVHSGSFDNAEAVEKGIELINKQNADLFVFTGDLVNNHAGEIEPWIDTFKKIKAKHGKFSILGNHDYGDYVQWPSVQAKTDNLDKLKSHHASMDFRLMLNENISIEKDGQSIKLVGIENWGKGFTMQGDLPKALNGVDNADFKVLLSHDPSHWDAQVKDHETHHIHLTLSGHTHGMQMGIETPLFKWSPVQYRYKNWAGLATENNRHLYVNRGFGFLGFSGRVGIWPEITVIELRKK